MTINRRAVIMAHDLAMTALAIVLAFALRLGAGEVLSLASHVLLTQAVMVPLAFVLFWRMKLPHNAWRFTSIPDFLQIVMASTILAVALISIDFFTRTGVLVPRTVPPIYWLLQIALMCGPRMLYRLHRDRRFARRVAAGQERRPVLLAGDDREAEQTIRRLEGGAALRIMGMLTDKPHRVGERIRGVEILGLFEDMPAILTRFRGEGVVVRSLIFTRESIEHIADIGSVIATARENDVATLRIAASLEQLGAETGPVKLAPIQIEDLLGRAPRELDMSPIKALVQGRRVLVTGAGGSIGSELVRQVAAMGPATLALLDRSEFALYGIAKEIAGKFPDLPTRQCLTDVCDRADVAQVFAAVQPELVFHAAALKHVDIVERHKVAAAETNTLGTRHVADETLAANALAAIFISTDKAVNPVSVLGTTKKAGEIYWAHADRQARAHGKPTRFITVRFGNVLGSSGSVIPLFAEQIARGGPVTVTHPDVERYFMTISEAVRLVLMASALGKQAAEASPTYVLDMGEPIRIVDLARQMIRLQGLVPEKDIAIVYSGLRPGERLTEYLEDGAQPLRETSVDGVQATDIVPLDATRLETNMAELAVAVAAHDADRVVGALHAVLVTPAETSRAADGV